MGRACGVARRTVKPRVLCLPRDRHDRVLGAVKRFLHKGMRGGWRVRRPRDRSGAIRTHTRGSGHMGRGRGGELACAGRQWSASPIKISKARGPAVPPLCCLAQPTLLRRAGRLRIMCFAGRRGRWLFGKNFGREAGAVASGCRVKDCDVSERRRGGRSACEWRGGRYGEHTRPGFGRPRCSDR